MKQQPNKKALLIAISLALVLATAVGATVAFLLSRTDSLKNAFLPSKVACEVVRDNNSYAVKNTGDTQAYIRAYIVLSWKNEDGEVLAQVPVSGEYAMTLGSGWFMAEDGFYYYPGAVEMDTVTEPLIANIQQLADGPVDFGGKQCYLSVEVVASAIQATASAVSDWSSTVMIDQDGNLTATH